MTSVSHEPVLVRRERSEWADVLRTRELWAAVAIVAMWLAVLFTGVYGPDFVSSNGSGTTTIPSAIGVAFFAFLGTASVAKAGFRRDRE